MKTNYELYVISLAKGYALPEFYQMQMDGWELAGPITTHQFNNMRNDPTITIPLKRKR